MRRLLADPRSQTLASNFAFQWLNMAKLGEIQPDVALFPMLNGDVREDFREELKLFVDSVFRENRSVMDLLSGNYTYVNERLALLYGIRDVKGDRFRRVQLTDSKRFGLLGKGAVLMVTSYPNRTAPVLRGAFVLERIMGTPPPLPPPNVGNIEENKEGVKPRTMKEIMAIHRSKPSCNGCHGIMDPLGFALEGFDAVGQERSRIASPSGIPVDTLGELPDGHVLKGPDDLRNALLERPDQFVQTLVEKLMVYATGRTLDYQDMPEVALHRARHGGGQLSIRIAGHEDRDQPRVPDGPRSGAGRSSRPRRSRRRPRSPRRQSEANHVHNEEAYFPACRPSWRRCRHCPAAAGRDDSASTALAATAAHRSRSSDSSTSRTARS